MVVGGRSDLTPGPFPPGKGSQRGDWTPLLSGEGGQRGARQPLPCREGVGGRSATLRRRSLAAVSLGWLAACSPFGGGGVPPLVFARDGNVEAIAPSGRDRRQLTDVPLPGYARDPAWAPDGSSILYSYTPPPQPQSGASGVSFTLPVADIYQLPSGGGDATLLIAHEGSTEQLETPMWSQDGRWVYFSYSALLVDSDNVITGRDFGIARVPATGGQREIIFTEAAFPMLSADGTRLAGVRQNPEDGATTLWVGAPDGSGSRTIIEAGVAEAITAPRFSPDGRQIVYSALVPPEERPLRFATPTPTPTPGRQAGLFDLLAPRPAAAAGLTHGIPKDLWLIGSDGTGLRRLTRLVEDDPAAVWSPDGSTLFIGAGGGLYILRLDGSPPVRIAAPGGHGLVDWRRSG